MPSSISQLVSEKGGEETLSELFGRREKPQAQQKSTGGSTSSAVEKRSAFISGTLLVKPNSYAVLVIHTINPDQPNKGVKELKIYPRKKIRSIALKINT